MTTDVIRKFIEEDYKDFVILVRCDNEHLYYHNSPGNSPLIWDWDKEHFMFIEPNDNILAQSEFPMQIHLIDFGDIQELTAYVDKTTALNFINNNITDEDMQKKLKSQLQKLSASMMDTKTLRQPSYDNH